MFWRTERSGVSITTLRALVGGRVVVFNTRAYFVSFAILGLGLLCACSFKEGQILPCCFDVAWVLSMTLKGFRGTSRRALLAQTGVWGASKVTEVQTTTLSRLRI